MNPLLQLLEHGQSFWLDNLSRPMIEGRLLQVEDELIRVDWPKDAPASR